MKYPPIGRMAAWLFVSTLLIAIANSGAQENKPAQIPGTGFYEGSWSLGNSENDFWLVIEPSPNGPCSVRGEITFGESLMYFKEGQRVAIHGSYYPSSKKFAARFSDGSHIDFQIDGQFNPDSNSIAAGVRSSSRDAPGSSSNLAGNFLCNLRMSQMEGGFPTLPSVEGLREDAARALISSVGIKEIFTIWEKENVTAKNAGMVKSQDPPAGLKIERLDLMGAVALTVYGDPDKVQVPDLSACKSREEITAALEAVSLVAAFSPEIADPPVKEFQFVSQDHPVGQLLKKSSPVSAKIREPVNSESAMAGEGMYIITSPSANDSKYTLRMEWRNVADDRAEVKISLPGNDAQVAELKKYGLETTVTFAVHREGGQYVTSGAEFEDWIGRILRAFLTMVAKSMAEAGVQAGGGNVADVPTPQVITRVRKASIVFTPKQSDFDMTLSLDLTFSIDGKDDSFKGDTKLFAKRQ